MNERTEFKRFSALVKGMAELHGKELTPALLDIYWLSLKGWQLSDFEKAVSHLLATLAWMPKPADFNALRNAGRQTAGEAWEAVVKLSLDWRNVQPDSVLLRLANQVGGLRRIAHADVERDLPFIEKRFKEAYEELERVEPVRAALPHIARPALHVAGLKSISTLLPNIQEPTQ